MDSQRRLPDQTLVIENGLLRSVGRSGEVDIRGMRTIDCAGLFAIPGLADMYSHYWDPLDAPLYLASGITTVRTVGTPFQLALERIAEAGAFPSPRMANLCPPIDGVGTSGRTDMPRGVAMTAPEQAQGLVQHFARRGYRQIKAFSLLTAENLHALVRAASPAGVRVSANCPNAMTMEEAGRAGVYCFDQLHNIARGHMRSDAPEPELWDRFDPLPGTRLDFAAIRSLARFMAERQIWHVPTLVFHQRDALAPEEGMRDPALKFVAASSIADWQSTLVRWTRRARLSDVDDWRAAARERARAFLEVIAIFREEGVPLLTGTDSLNPWNVQGDSLHAELANFVAAGMSPYEALRCATIEAARFLGESERSGTIAPGKRADLVLMRSDPLANIGALRAIEAVCVNGYYVPRTSLDKMLEQRAALTAAPPQLPPVQGEAVWVERIMGTPSGRIAYRHSPLPEGGWLIEEQHAQALPRRHVERRTSRLALDAHFQLQSCAYRIDSFAGSETGDISRSQSGEYVLHAREVDGWESKASLAAEPLVPSERLTLTLWPLLFAQRPKPQALLLDVENGALTVRQMRLARQDGEWRLAVERPTQLTEQLYRLAPDGRFLGMQEMMPLMWLRELVP